MRKDTQAATHVQLPNDVGRRVVLEDLLPIRTSVLTITETLCIEATKLAFSGDVIQPVPFHIRHTCRGRQQELSQTSLYSWGHVLPKEFAILRLKCHEHAGFFLDGGVHVSCVVGAHIDRIATNNGTTIRFVAQLDTPDDVPTGSRIPVNRRIAGLDDCCFHREASPLGLLAWLARGGPTPRAGRQAHSLALVRAVYAISSSDSTQRPLCFVTQCGIVCRRLQRLPGRLCLRPDASQSSGRENAHIQEFILQSFD